MCALCKHRYVHTHKTRRLMSASLAKPRSKSSSTCCRPNGLPKPPLPPAFWYPPGLRRLSVFRVSCLSLASHTHKARQRQTAARTLKCCAALHLPAGESVSGSKGVRQGGESGQRSVRSLALACAICGQKEQEKAEEVTLSNADDILCHTHCTLWTLI